MLDKQTRNGPPHADDAIIAALNASDRAARRMVQSLLAAVLALVAVYAAFFFSGHAAFLASQTVQFAIAVLFALAVVIVMLNWGRKFRPDVYSDANEPHIVRRRIDAHHRYWRATLLSLLLSIASWVFSFGQPIAELARIDRVLALLWGGVFIVVIGLFSVLTISGPGWYDRRLHAILNDEFVRELRGRTARLGYLTMIAAVSVSLLVAIWRPEYTFTALCWSLVAGFAIPALYYVIADWRAERED